jgi:CheY-like chemotaxis protein
VANAEEAIAIAATQNPDVIVLDLMTPRMLALHKCGMNLDL